LTEDRRELDLAEQVREQAERDRRLQAEGDRRKALTLEHGARRWRSGARRSAALTAWLNGLRSRACRPRSSGRGPMPNHDRIVGAMSVTGISGRTISAGDRAIGK
jgi:hypothetical protein